MGSIFNTQGTLEIIDLLSRKFTWGFTSAAADTTLIARLDPSSGMQSHDVASHHGLVPSTPGADPRWARWLKFFDANGGMAARKVMADALRNTGRYEAIEFFAVPDPSFVVSTADVLNTAGTKYSLVVHVRTPTIDSSWPPP
jgi:hypothetical protein